MWKLENISCTDLWHCDLGSVELSWRGRAEEKTGCSQGGRKPGSESEVKATVEEGSVSAYVKTSRKCGPLSRQGHWVNDFFSGNVLGKQENWGGSKFTVCSVTAKFLGVMWLQMSETSWKTFLE